MDYVKDFTEIPLGKLMEASKVLQNHHHLSSVCRKKKSDSFLLSQKYTTRLVLWYNSLIYPLATLVISLVHCPTVGI